MLNYRQTLPPPALRGAVARFSQRRCRAAHRHSPAFGLPARLDRFIEVYLGEPVRVGQAGQTPDSVPDIVLVAPHTRPGKRLQMVGDVDTFTIHVEPTGLHRLFGLPLQGHAAVKKAHAVFFDVKFLGEPGPASQNRTSVLAVPSPGGLRISHVANIEVNPQAVRHSPV